MHSVQTKIISAALLISLLIILVSRAKYDRVYIPGTYERTITVQDGSQLTIIENSADKRDSRRPVLFLHGLGNHGYNWKVEFSALTDQYRCIAWDMRGHNKSKKHNGLLTLKHVMIDLKNLIEILDLRNAILVGHSMGGMAILKLCAKYPNFVNDRISGIVLTSTSMSMRQHILQKPTSLSPNQLHKCVTDGLKLMSRVKVGDLLASYISINELDIWDDELSAIKVPTIVVVGENDFYTPVEYAQSISKNISGSRLVVVPGLGHNFTDREHSQLVDLIKTL